ncbi:transglutaminase-like cysteine peptidase [Ochrobactrum sp. GRS2]|nr:transglutaminase-like cysteine peptidase [Ochrobactrum sp. GRS2]
MFSFVKFKNLTLSAAGLMLALGALAQATELNAPFMATGGQTSQPIGHYEFCKRMPAECNVTSTQTAPVKLDQATWAKIVQVNVEVNALIQPMTDMEIYGVEEYWTYSTTVGDCEEYVLLKRRELAKAGIPLSSLLITVLRKPDGEGHAVLTVRTDRGDFILDNLTDAVKNWQETDYTYLKRQAANHTGRWVSIETPSNLVVGAVK